MKFLFLYFILFSFHLFALKNETQKITLTPPTTYDDVPSFVKEKPSPIIESSVQNQGQTISTSSNVATSISFQRDDSHQQIPHMDHGFNMDNIDPNLQIVRVSDPAVQYNDDLNNQAPVPKEKSQNLEENPNQQQGESVDFQKTNVETSKKLDKTHNLSTNFYQNIFHIN